MSRSRFWLTLILSLGGLFLLGLWVRFLFFPTRGELTVLVPPPEDNKDSFHSAVLSPERDKLLYVEIGQPHIFILELVTNKLQKTTPSCTTYAWIDNNTVACQSSRTLVDVRDGSARTVQVINYREQPVDLTELITENHEVYEPEGWEEARVLLVVAEEPQPSYYLYWVPEELPPHQDVPITVIPRRLDLVIDRVSPNREYYFRQSQNEWLHIYDKQDRLVAETNFEGYTTYVIGWAYDSSGVILFSSQGFLDTTRHPIYKLKVPE